LDGAGVAAGAAGVDDAAGTAAGAAVDDELSALAAGVAVEPSEVDDALLELAEDAASAALRESVR
jgi:hypothetical protein